MKQNIISISGKAGAGKDLVGSIIQYLTVSDYENVKNILQDRNQREISITEHFNSFKERDYKVFWKIKKFATPIKQIASIMTGIPVEDMERQEFKESFIGDEWITFPLKDTHPTVWQRMTLRRLLQEIGDVMLQIHPDWLLNVMFKDYVCIHCGQNPCSIAHKNVLGMETKFPSWIITDMRKPNEYNKVKEYGGKCIKVIKTGQISTDNHISETALDNETEWDYIIEAEHGDIDSLIRQVKEMLIKFEIL